MNNNNNYDLQTKPLDSRKYLDEQIKLIKVKSISDDRLKNFAIVYNRGLLDFLYRMVPIYIKLNHQNDYGDLDERIDRTLQVVYIREQLTDYNPRLFIGEEVLESDLINEYRKAVFAEISCVYPELSDECNRQFEIWKKVKNQQELYEELAQFL